MVRWLMSGGRDPHGLRDSRSLLRPAPDVQNSFPKSGDKGIGCVRRQDLGKVVKRTADHDRKFVCWRVLRPSATYVQTALALLLRVHRLRKSQSVWGPGAERPAPRPPAPPMGSQGLAGEHLKKSTTEKV